LADNLARLQRVGRRVDAVDDVEPASSSSLRAVLVTGRRRRKWSMARFVTMR
jgi:hypothetical protein